MFDRSDFVEKPLSSTAGSQVPEILSIKFLGVLRRSREGLQKVRTFHQAMLLVGARGVLQGSQASTDIFLAPATNSGGINA